MNYNNETETRQGRREKRLKKKGERMPKHGKNLIKIYREAVLRIFKRKDNSKNL
jgi:hypothetical protein